MVHSEKPNRNAIQRASALPFLLAPFSPSRHSRDRSHAVRVKGAATRQALMLAMAYFDVTIGTDNQSIRECCHGRAEQ